MIRDSLSPRIASSRSLVCNPLSIFCLLYAYQIIAIPLLWVTFVPALVNVNAYVLTFELSLIYPAGVIGGWILAPRLGAGFVSRGLSFLSGHAACKRLTPTHLRFISICFLVLAAISFVVLARLSGAGTLWLTDSRSAYQFYRKGVGFLWSLTISFLYLSYIYWMHELFTGSFGRPSKWRLVVTVMFFLFLSMFLGSKGVMVGFLLFLMIYYNYNVAPVNFRGLSLFMGASLVLATALQFLQGTAGDFGDTVQYTDYFQNTAEFLRRFDDFGGFQHGLVFLSSFWAYVPRGLYPNKPFEYGQLLINSVLFPGAAEQTRTPGLLPWAGDYLDFGPLGVLGSGMALGLFMGWINVHYQKRKSVVGFIILLQLGFSFVIFPFLPGPLFLLLALPSFAVLSLLTRVILVPKAPARRTLASPNGEKPT